MSFSRLCIQTKLLYNTLSQVSNLHPFWLPVQILNHQATPTTYFTRKKLLLLSNYMFDNPHITVFWKSLKHLTIKAGNFVTQVNVHVCYQEGQKILLKFKKKHLGIFGIECKKLSLSVSLSHQNNSPYTLRICNFLTFNFTFRFVHESCLTLTLNTDAKGSIYCCKENYNYTLCAQPWLLKCLHSQWCSET